MDASKSQARRPAASMAARIMIAVASWTAAADCSDLSPSNTGNCGLAGAIDFRTPHAQHVLVTGMTGLRSYHRHEVQVLGVGRRLEILVSSDASDYARDHLGAKWRDVERLIARAWAQMPPIVHAATPRGTAIVLVDSSDDRAYFCSKDEGMHCAGEARFEIMFPVRQSVVQRGGKIELAPGFEENLLHEIGHLYQYSQTDSWHHRTRWNAAVERDDGRYVTAYARTDSIEDFADSFMAWVLLRAHGGKLSDDARQRIRSIPARLAYFDSLHRRLSLGHAYRAPARPWWGAHSVVLADPMSR